MSTTTEQQLRPVVEPGEDFLDKLTISELGIIGRQLKADPVAVVSDESPGGHPQRWEAMARCGWMLDRRRDSSVPVDRWLELSIPQLLDALAIDPATVDEDRAAEQQLDDESPTGPALEL